MKGLGAASRESGQSRVPAPPERMIGTSAIDQGTPREERWIVPEASPWRRTGRSGALACAPKPLEGREPVDFCDGARISMVAAARDPPQGIAARRCYHGYFARGHRSDLPVADRLPGATWFRRG